MDAFTDHASGWALALAVLVIAVLGLALLRDPSPDPAFVGVAVLGSAWVLATVFDAVRHHEYFHVANAVCVTALGVLLFLGGDDAVPFVALFVGIGVAGIVAEVYNLRNDTSHLRCGARRPEETEDA